MRKLTHSDFELDLSNFKISDTEQNSWFNDVFFTKFTFPFEIDLIKDLDIAFGFISLYNTTPKTYFDCKYVHNNEIQDAVLEITELGEKLSCTLEYGFEQLPSFDKKLSELSLETFDLPIGTDIYQHANTVITQAYPAVNYNFPAVHTDKYDTSQEPWLDFEKTINNRQAGQFVQNIYNTTEEWSENYNIMQPLPYWLHILERGFADAGYTFAGEILQDDLIKKALLFGDVDNYVNLTKNEYNDLICESYDHFNTTYVPSPIGFFYYKSDFNKSISVSDGFYRIIGDIYLTSVAGIATEIKLVINGAIIYSTLHVVPATNTGSFSSYSWPINIPITLNSGTNIIQIISTQVWGLDPSTNYYQVCDLSINRLAKINSSGVALPSLFNENKIQLKKAVPDITFNDFIKVIKNWFNYDLTVIDKVVYMDKIESNINHNNAIDMQVYEVKTPRRKYHTGTSFELKFQDIDNKDYPFVPVFHSHNQIVNTGYTTNEKTNTIEIQALPLPHLNRNSLMSAYAFENNDSKVYLVPYNGLVNNKNLSQPNDAYLLPVIHLGYWKKWFDFRIKAIGYAWAFKAFEVNILNLKSKVKIYAYGNTHIIKTIQRTEIATELYNIEIETESLR